MAVAVLCCLSASTPVVLPLSVAEWKWEEKKKKKEKSKKIKPKIRGGKGGKNP